ncbi:MAG: zinc ribbon domain-containing protein [Cyanobacteria bacterium SID2]|nr:zinc ribbon domain-containing protein [Cyanobacteria bacterium SID2]MBP0004629.1 zinc ribbon domain-containing protein [Cyanobacteria bacterium SBC]
MTHCPRCDRPVPTDAVSCPHCRYSLKAFGHPGIPLHRAAKDEFLCNSCVYHHDDTCNFPQRPNATTCTLYQNLDESIEDPLPPRNKPVPWYRRYPALWVLLALFVVSLLLAL